MVPFAGWNMPVQYAGISAEHLAVRSSCGIFDISHMGEFFVTGPGATAWLNGLLTNNTARLQPGEGQYTLLLNEAGGVIDDLIAYRLSADEWFLVVNAARLDEDRTWLIQHAVPGITFRDESPHWAAMAIQGPRAPEVFAAMTGGAASLPPRNGAVAIQLNDLAPDRTPLEAGLGFFVDMEKGPFMGRDVLARQKAAGLTSRLAAIRMAPGAPPPRPHYPVIHAGETIGELCSGGVSPSLGTGIAMAYLPIAATTQGTAVEIEIRGNRWPAEIVRKPFYRKPTPA